MNNSFPEKQYPDAAGGTLTPDPRPYRRVWLNLLLFGVTVLTTMMTGAGFLGIYSPQLLQDFSLIFIGWKFSFAVLTILTFHEFGHYFAARWHGLWVTLPFYIPLPLPDMFHFGTMGAFIRIKSPISNRRALMDVAVAGPLAGFVVSLVFLFLGYSQIKDLQQVIAHVETVHPWSLAPGEGVALTMGKSLLFFFFNDVVGRSLIPMSEIYHFPLIFAGWIGLLVTAINLFPIGQLDGGHIIYALLGKKAGVASVTTFAALGVLTAFLFWQRGAEGTIWLPWMIILSLIGLRHPPTLDDSVELTTGRRNLGLLCIFIFVICFMPLPVYL